MSLTRSPWFIKTIKTAKEQNLSPQERLLFHQRESGPVMKNLKQWLSEQIEQKKTEPNSGLGKAITYMLKHWEPLTLFLRVPGAPLDNNICEQTLKKAILHRKNSLVLQNRAWRLHRRYVHEPDPHLQPGECQSLRLPDGPPETFLRGLQKPRELDALELPGSASPSTIPDEPAPPNILNQTLPTALQPEGLGNVCPHPHPRQIFFRYAGLPETHDISNLVSRYSLKPLPIYPTNTKPHPPGPC